MSLLLLEKNLPSAYFQLSSHSIPVRINKLQIWMEVVVNPYYVGILQARNWHNAQLYMFHEYPLLINTCTNTQPISSCFLVISKCSVLNEILLKLFSRVMTVKLAFEPITTIANATI